MHATCEGMYVAIQVSHKVLQYYYKKCDVEDF